MITRLNDREFLLFRDYIADQCGILLGDDKAYLIESRLSRLLVEHNLDSFEGLYHYIYSRQDRRLAERIIDAITTNETFWFRDRGPWMIMERHLLPAFVEMLRQDRRKTIRIWSAACSTGQEPYSIAMLIDRYLETRHITDVSLKDFDIIASDISDTVLEIARNARYDQISIMRGLDRSYMDQYFVQSGRTWTLNERIRASITFRHYNLQDSFMLLGSFDLIFMRNVLMYFSEALKKDIINKISRTLLPGGHFFIGAAEILTSIEGCFIQRELEQSVVFQLKG